jgi:hypothetical protein
MDCFGEFCGLLRGHERPLAYDPFRVNCAITRVISRQLNHGVEDLLGETLFLRRRRRAGPNAPPASIPTATPIRHVHNDAFMT